jgi:hypothetical protein
LMIVPLLQLMMTSVQLGICFTRDSSLKTENDLLSASEEKKIDNKSYSETLITISYSKKQPSIQCLTNQLSTRRK